MAINGAKLLVECMLKAGVERIYGIIGTSNVAFVDALYDARERIRYISCRHEQVAASMADTEGRLTGKPGVVLTHSGPGALNAAISLANAAKDCSPMIAVTGAVKRKLEKVDGMLQLDHLSVFAPLCRAVFRVDETEKIPEVFRNAWEAATGPPPGPVLIEVPEDVWMEQVEEPSEIESPVMRERPAASYKEVEEVLEFLNAAERPLLLCGGGISDDKAWAAARLAEALNLPVVTTGNGRGVMPETHPLSLCRCGFGGGSPVADFALENANLIVAAGCTISDMTTYEFTLPVKAEVVTVNLDSEQNMPGIALKKALIADAGAFLDSAVAACGYDKAPARSEWFAMLDQPKKTWQQLVKNNINPNKKPLSPGFVCREIAKYMEDSDIVTVGAGMHLLYPMAHIPCLAPRTFLTAANFGAMGFGLAAGIAAKMLKPERKVVTIIGDGDVMMTVQDLETAVREKVPVKVFVLNDSAYRVLLFRQKMQFAGRVLGTTHGNPDFARLAEAFGAKGMRLEEPDDVEPLVREAMESEEPTVVEVLIDPDDVAPTNLQAVLRMSQG